MSEVRAVRTVVRTRCASVAVASSSASSASSSELSVSLQSNGSSPLEPFNLKNKSVGLRAREHVRARIKTLRVLVLSVGEWIVCERHPQTADTALASSFSTAKKKKSIPGRTGSVVSYSCMFGAFPLEEAYRKSPGRHEVSDRSGICDADLNR